MLSSVALPALASGGSDLAETLVKAAIGVVGAQLILGAIALFGAFQIGRRFMSVEFPAFRAEITDQFRQQHVDLQKLREAVENLKVDGARLDESDSHLERRIGDIENEIRDIRRGAGRQGR